MSIKPTKNTYYCPACSRTKMLFQSEKEALTFLRYNQEEIEESNGKAPVRAYYCDMCLGWHLTSQEHAYSISSSELLQRRLHIDAYHELSRYKATMDEIEQAYQEKEYNKILAPGLSLIKKMVKVKMYSKEAQEKRQEMCRIVDDSFHNEMVRLTSMMRSGNYQTAYAELEAIQLLLGPNKNIKREEIAVIYRRCASYIATMQTLYQRRIRVESRLEEQKELLAIKAEFCNLVSPNSRKKLGKIKYHDKAIALLQNIQKAEEKDLFRPREDMLQELRSFIMDNIMQYMQAVDKQLIDGYFEEATIMMDELDEKIREAYTLDDFQLLRDFYYQTLILITRRKMKIEVAYIDKEKKHK